MKTIWPIGARDILMNTHLVEYGDRAWYVNSSVEDDLIPITPKQLRVQMPLSMVSFKPNPIIHGYTLIISSEFNFGGSIPNSLIQAGSVKGSIAAWTKMQKILAKELEQRQKDKQKIEA